MSLQVQDYQHEMTAAMRSYEKYVICVDKTPEDFLKSMQSLLAKAIEVFEHRASGLRHGLALDRHMTIILSQSETDRPLCGIYFNLYSPHRKTTSTKPH